MLFRSIGLAEHAPQALHHAVGQVAQHGRLIQIEELHGHGRHAVEQQRQTIPASPLEIAADIACIHVEFGLNGKLIFTESKNPHNPESHCDMAWSAALAKMAGEQLDMVGPCRADAAQPPAPVSQADDDDDEPRDPRRDW